MRQIADILKWNNYNEHISEIKSKNTVSNLNFAKLILENDHNINFDINTDFYTLKTKITFTLTTE